jgi:hypothetical protein
MHVCQFAGAVGEVLQILHQLIEYEERDEDALHVFLLSKQSLTGSLDWHTQCQKRGLLIACRKASPHCEGQPWKPKPQS